LVDTKDGTETSSRFQAVDGNSEFTMNNTGKTFPKLQSTNTKESPFDYCVEKGTKNLPTKPIRRQNYHTDFFYSVS